MATAVDIRHRTVSEPVRRGPWDTPWPFLTFWISIIAAFAMVGMAVALHRAEHRSDQTKKLALTVLALAQNQHTQGQAVITLANMQLGTNKSLGYLLRTQQAQLKTLSVLADNRGYQVVTHPVVPRYVISRVVKPIKRPAATAAPTLRRELAGVPGIPQSTYLGALR